MEKHWFRRPGHELREALQTATGRFPFLEEYIAAIELHPEDLWDITIAVSGQDAAFELRRAQGIVPATAVPEVSLN